MQAALASAALVMGFVGGPHCVAMCGAPTAGIIRLVRAPAGLQPQALHAAAPSLAATLAFQAGRLASYAAAGAAVALAAQSLAYAGGYVTALRPLWVLLHAATLAWGVALILLGRQPTWAHQLGRTLAHRLRLHTGSISGVLATGALWVLMPCGLLYSALALASLGNDALAGATAMVLFGLGSGLSLAVAPWVYQRLDVRLSARHQRWGARIAGVMLALLALDALWMDVGGQIAHWCR